MNSQSSKFIIPFSTIVIISLAALLVFVFIADNQGWFSSTDELIAQLEDDDEIDETPVSVPLSRRNELLQLTAAEIAEFNTIDNCYTIIDNNIYRLSEEFITSSEQDVFDELVCGTESTEAFNTQVEYTQTDISEFLLGEVVLVSVKEESEE